MAALDTVAETWSITQLATGGSVGMILLAIANSVLNRKTRKAQDDNTTSSSASTLAAGSVEWAAQVVERYDKLEAKYETLNDKYDELDDKYDELERRMNRQQDANARHKRWDDMMAARLRDAGIADFPDPPSLEVA